MRTVKFEFWLDVDKKMIGVPGKAMDLRQFFESDEYSTDFKLGIVRELTFELRIRGFNGYDIHKYIQDVWPEYERLRS